MEGRCENLHVVKGSPEKKVLKKVAVRWPKGTRWVSHVAFYTGARSDKELLDVVPVNWWTGKVKPNFEKLKGLGKTPDKPVYSEPRYKTIFDMLGLGHLNLIIGTVEQEDPAPEEAASEAKQPVRVPEDDEAFVPTPEKAEAEAPTTAKKLREGK